MIEIFEGRLGGGKSYSAVMRILAHVGTGGALYTNVELNWLEVVSFVEDRFGVHPENEQYTAIREEDVPKFFEKVPLGQATNSTAGAPVLCVIDEAHLFFNSRDWDKTSRAFLAWLTQSRKFGIDIIFISQSNLNMDKQFIRLIQYIWRFRDLARFTIPGLGMRLPFVGNKILQVKFDYDGKTYLERFFVRKDVRVFKCYDSNALLKPIPGYETMLATDKVVRKQLKKRQQKKHMWKTYLAIFIAFGVMVTFLCYRQAQKFMHPSNANPVTRVLPTHENREGATPPKREPAYDIRSELFRSWDGENLKTNVAFYRPGKMCLHGMVVAVSEGVVKIAQPDGRYMYVVSDPVDYSALIVHALPAPEAQALRHAEQEKPIATPETTPVQQQKLKVPDWMIKPAQSKSSSTPNLVH